MFKLALWLTAPTLVTFLASSSSVRLENTVLIFALTVVLLLFGLGPRLPGRHG